MRTRVMDILSRPGSLAVLAVAGILAGMTPPFATAAQAGPVNPAPVQQNVDEGNGSNEITTKMVLPKGVTSVTPKAPPASQDPSPLAFHGRFNELQMNLCNGGEAACYQSGLAVGEAYATIDLIEPDAVTLNEVCSADVLDSLIYSMADVWPNDIVFAAFGAATVGNTWDPYKCRNGDDFGNGVIVHIPLDEYYGFDATWWRYGNQDSGTEKRTAICGYVAYSYILCGTHLSAADPSIAMLQCRGMLQSIIPQVRDLYGFYGEDVIIGGDFNLRYSPGATYNVQNCIDPGYTRKGDGSVQHIITYNTINFANAYRVGMVYTDHPGLVAELDRQ